MGTLTQLVSEAGQIVVVSVPDGLRASVALCTEKSLTQIIRPMSGVVITFDFYASFLLHRSRTCFAFLLLFLFWRT